MNVTDRSAIHTAEAQTLPRKVICGAIEIIMHFESTTSFTDHGSTPFVECEMTRILIESCISLLPWSKHERCHARVLNQAVENTASLARHLDLVPHRQVGQHVPVRRRRVTSRLIDRSINAHGSIVRGDRIFSGPLP